MKNAIVASVLALLIPLPVFAVGKEISSDVHLFQTTFNNRDSRDGFIAVTQNQVRISLAPDGQFMDIRRLNSNPNNDDMIFFKDRQEMMYITHENETYGVMNAETMDAMKRQREEMMSGLGVKPGSGQDEALMKAFGDAMKKFQDARRQGIEEAMKDKAMSPEDRSQMDAYMKKTFPKSEDPHSIQVTKTGKSGREKDISCLWYKLVAAGIRHICVANWDDVPRGQRTKQMFHAWYNFMEKFAKGLPIKNNPFEELKRIDGFPLVTIFKDEDGNTISEQRYTGTERRKVSYDPPPGYTEESHTSFGKRKKHRQNIKIDNPSNPPSSGGATQEEESECVLTEKGIVCK